MGKSLRIQVGTSRNPRGGESLIYWRIWGTLLQLDPLNTDSNFFRFFSLYLLKNYPIVIYNRKGTVSRDFALNLLLQIFCPDSAVIHNLCLSRFRESFRVKGSNRHNMGHRMVKDLALRLYIKAAVIESPLRVPPTF